MYKKAIDKFKSSVQYIENTGINNFKLVSGDRLKETKIVTKPSEPSARNNMSIHVFD